MNFFFFKSFLLLIPTVFLLGASFGLAKPNMIVIMCDDLGYADVGFNGCKHIPTPNIDSISENGVRCTNGYVAYPVYGPSRAGFITARYPQRFGFERNPQYKPHDPDMGLTHEEKTIPELLKPAGYPQLLLVNGTLGHTYPRAIQ